VVGTSFGKVRFLHDGAGKQLKSAGPSSAVQFIGLKELAEPGDDIIVVESEEKAKAVANYR
jgi:translation initiation factor IF-2